MSILIKGMEMPKDCRECPVVQRTKSGLRCPILSKHDGFSHTASRGIIGRMGGCPLVEVPASHGRIADMDEAIKCIEEVKGKDAELAISLIEWACGKRTIIEAESEVGK